VSELVGSISVVSDVVSVALQRFLVGKDLVWLVEATFVSFIG
jgi:hypothetical protein